MALELGPTKIVPHGQWGFGGIEGFPLTASISSPFGPRVPILTPQGWTSDFHSGIDLPAPHGTPILAPADCTVCASYTDGAGGHTLVVRFEDNTGAMCIHMEGLQLGVGANVARGAILGFVGTSGLSTGDHLHYSRLRAVLDGPVWYDRSVFIDPLGPEGGFVETLTVPVPPVTEFTLKQRAEQIRDWANAGAPSQVLVTLLDDLIVRLT